MSDDSNVVPIRPDVRFMPPPRLDGEAPFLLRVQAETMRLGAEASQANWLAGFRRGIVYMVPWVIAAFIGGAAFAQWVLK